MGDDEARRGVDPSRDAWSEPGAEKVAPGVHRIPLPLPMDGLRAVNVYAIEDGDGLTLIDGGWAIDVAWELLERSLAELGHRLSDIRRVLVTHVHRDHYTQAIAIRRAVGAEVSLGIGEQRSMREMGVDRTGMIGGKLHLLRRLGAGAVADDLAALPVDQAGTLDFYEDPDVWLEPGRIELATRSLEAIHTPGHTSGHLVFHAPEDQLLFAGDHVLPSITPSIGFEPVRPAFPLRDYLGSLERMLLLPDALLLPAHGPAGGSVHARVDALLAHHAQRLDDTLDALEAGAGLALDVARALRWTGRGRRFDELGLFDRMLAVLETAAHLDVLVLRGQAVRDERGDAVVYGTPVG